jgi:hypothetical protein
MPIAAAASSQTGRRMSRRMIARSSRRIASRVSRWGRGNCATRQHACGNNTGPPAGTRVGFRTKGNICVIVHHRDTSMRGRQRAPGAPAPSEPGAGSKVRSSSGFTRVRRALTTVPRNTPKVSASCEKSPCTALRRRGRSSRGLSCASTRALARATWFNVHGERDLLVLS